MFHFLPVLIHIYNSYTSSLKKHPSQSVVLVQVTSWPNMTSILSLTISLFCVVSFVSGDLSDVKKEENVLVLTNSNFESVINEHKFVLAEFCKYFGWYDDVQ